VQHQHWVPHLLLHALVDVEQQVVAQLMLTPLMSTPWRLHAAAAASSAAANDAFAAANAVAEAAVEAAICAHIETRQHGPTNLPTRVAAFKAGDKQLPWNALRHSRPSQNSKSCCRSLREHLVQ
jgi:hypothetical protein